ncbi:MAG TPA: hypothetical protein VIY28_00310, partial [Pseudonocardiaceae bacterium]
MKAAQIAPAGGMKLQDRVRARGQHRSPLGRPSEEDNLETIDGGNALGENPQVRDLGLFQYRL